MLTHYQVQHNLLFSNADFSSYKDKSRDCAGPAYCLENKCAKYKYKQSVSINLQNSLAYRLTGSREIN